ncbi:MAG: MG2 domain-containing protein [Thermoguttaceae bacterium]
MSAADSADLQSHREQAYKSYQQGNYNDAYEAYRKLALDPNDDIRQVGEDLHMATACLQPLNRVDEIDEFREKVVDIHKNNWRLLLAAAQNYLNQPPHYGFMVAGKFCRGNKRGGGNLVNATDRDRVRALQLMAQAMPLAQKDENHGEVGAFFLSLADILLADRRGLEEAWRLQYLSDLKDLPDYEPGWNNYRETRGAPVDADGKPVFHKVPKSFESAETDGQRWRWCLQQAAEFDSSLMDNAHKQFAHFLHQQFGVETIAYYGWRFGRLDTDDTKEDESGVFALHTLGENETIAHLATGVKRFGLPDEFNFIKIYQQIAANPKSAYALESLEQLAEIFENRRQYSKAADYWRRLIKEFPDADKNRRQRWKDQLEQIVGNWGRFEPAATQPADKGASVEFRFRNGTAVDFTAHEIKVDKFLDDIKTYLKSNPRELDWEKIDFGAIGHRLLEKTREQYLGRQVAQWQMDVKPRENHFDRRVTVTTPLSKSGAYLLEAKMKDGNTNFIVLWIDDTAIVKKPLEGKTFYFVADAVTGKPVPKANLEFFGWQSERLRNGRSEIHVKDFAEFTDADGQVILDLNRQPREYQWLIIARTDEGRLAYLGFTNVWQGNWYDSQYNATKVYAITDRPVYRPDQTVKYKFWVRHAKYDMKDVSDFAGREFTVEIYNPKGEKIISETKKADAWGGLEGEYKIPADASLGVFNLSVKDLGGGSFRVEEYKKPEFEVTIDAPAEPVMLGEKISATIKAKYYFGSPVTKAKVKYKIYRSSHDEQWYPWGPWDWLYGPGYWWFAYDYDWYPGWRSWGCLRPIPFWWPRGNQPPELVADQEVDIGPDGTVKIEIDTAVAKAIHPDQDHKYSITAEVVDESRRTIVGTGNVLVARKPFSVYTWLDRGYYRVGDTIQANFNARTIDGKPVQGKGELTLLKISYEKDKPVETPVQTWQIDTNEQGQAQQQITAGQAGQYRLSYKLTSSPRPLGEGPGVRAAQDSAVAGPHPNPLPKGEGTAKTIEGGYIFTIIGQGVDAAQFRFNRLELIPDKREYAPGETVKLQINTDRIGGTVLLFIRPANGIYLPPKVLRLAGKSAVYDVAVAKKDMPNFFIEAVTVADGRVNNEVKEIVVPPEKRILNVEIQPSAEAYKPGEKAKVKIKLTDLSGEPFVGSTVVAIYDKSLEYISGGSNVPDIKEFFWKWRRSHSANNNENSLARWFQPMVQPNAKGMADLGIFGGAVAEEMEGLSWSDASGANRGQIPTFNGVVFRGGIQRLAREKGGMGAMAESALVPAAPMAAAAMPPMEGMADNLKMPMEKATESGAALLVEPSVRTKFADTALWVGALTTEKDGTAEVSLNMPENLTTWRIKVWGMGHGTKVGQGYADVVTRKDLIIRMEAPRFFVQTDEGVLSAVVHNYLKTKKHVMVKIELGENKLLELIPGLKDYGLKDNGIKKDIYDHRIVSERYVDIEPNGEARVDWRVKVLDEGEAVIRMKALTDEESDAMEQKFPCYIHGMLKTDSYSGVIRPKDESGKFTFNVPQQRRPKQSRLEVRYSPTLAGAMVDALPYLVDYPYGCTEQTLNRFLPTVITQKVLLDMKLNLKEIREKRTNLNAQEIGDDRERAKQWGRLDKHSPHPNPLPKGEGTKNPVFNEDEVRNMVKEGVDRLVNMQLSDGGWGWFSGWGERSSAHTTAYVVHGLQIARQNDVALVPGVLERGIQWLTHYQDEQIQLLKNAAVKDKPENLRWKDHADNLDAFVYMVLVDGGVKNADMLEFLYRDRTEISVYAMAMYGIALEKQGEKEKLDMIMRNIGQYVQQDDENQTAWLRLPDGFWWHWYGSEYEAHAYYLKLLSKTDPKGELAARIVKYLLNNRKHAAYWNSTRDTALCIEAMADFIRASGEDKPDMTVEVYFDGKLQKAVEITPKNLFTFDNKFTSEGQELSAGQHLVELKKKGTGPLYYNGYATNFTLEEFITKAGLEIKVNRKYYKLIKADKTIKAAGSRGQAVDEKVEKYEREELPSGAYVKSGDLVEIELEIDSKNDYEYLIFEDMKPAGFEPVDQRSGYTGNALGAYVEFRDNRVVFFARSLARGKHGVSYRMRAEIPGKFSALPTRASAMYAPELKGNSDELKIGVMD